MRESDVLARTYNHQCQVLRPSAVPNSNFDDFEYREVHSNLKCAVSFQSKSKDGKSETTQAIQYVALLFVRPEVQIKPGDKIIADIEGIEIEFLAGEGARYPSHNEIPLMRESDA